MSAFEDIRAEETENWTNVMGVKGRLQLIGEDCGTAAPPSAWPLTDVQMEKMRQPAASLGPEAVAAILL